MFNRLPAHRYLMLAFLPLLLLATPIVEPMPQAMDQERAYSAARSRQLLPLADLRARVQAMMPDAQYIGVEFDPPSGIYTLKFLRNGSVIWVQVDGRTGRVLGHTGG